VAETYCWYSVISASVSDLKSKRSQTMKMLGINHVGVTVRNLERSVEFYRDIFGAKLIESPCDMVEDQEESKGLGVPGSVHRICLMEFGPGQYIEFMEFGDVESPHPETLPLNQLGNHHISLSIDNMAEWEKKITGMNLEFLYKPIPYVNKDESVSYWALFKDPDGIAVELLQK
jgi:catechol 2,3-dioxygenase-like lactoylglutathione lyase family enzyme